MSIVNHGHVTDLRGYGRLAADATAGVASLVEALHYTIRRAVGPPRGITPRVYLSIRLAAWLAGRGLDAALAVLAARLPVAAPTPRQEAIRAAVNGVYGDHLAATANPLAIPMRLRRGGEALTLARAELAAAIPDAGSRAVVLVHGLCTNDLRWRRNGHDHGAALERDLGLTPVYLHYNSGRRIADNGSEFAMLLESLAAEWPVPLKELTIIGHSMGGLVARSAIEAARAERHVWLKRLRRVVFLGTPHHGAPLERLGSWIETALLLNPYLAPFARLGAARSAGITDLRHGSVVENEGSRMAPVVPLPRGIECFAIAAALGRRARPVRDRLIGDGFVPVASALGRHRHPQRTLAFPPARQWIARDTTHFGLLGRRQVYVQLRKWLAS